MDKLMPVDILSSIKGAKSSESVNKLFAIIKSAHTPNNNCNYNSVLLNELREDFVIESSALTKEIIRENFPKEKEGYLVVSKVING